MLVPTRAPRQPRGESAGAVLAFGQGGNVDLKCLILSPFLLSCPTAKSPLKALYAPCV